MRAEGIFAFLCVPVCSRTDVLIGKTLFVAVSASGRLNDRDGVMCLMCHVSYVSVRLWYLAGL